MAEQILLNSHRDKPTEASAKGIRDVDLMFPDFLKSLSPAATLYLNGTIWQRHLHNQRHILDLGRANASSNIRNFGSSRSGSRQGFRGVTVPIKTPREFR